ANLPYMDFHKANKRVPYYRRDTKTLNAAIRLQACPHNPPSKSIFICRNPIHIVWNFLTNLYLVLGSSFTLL
ncbi:hypothetical protein, partial [Acinetobacter baumannii]|uniref:hypothetical protein n=1 Tax=Acinetobacter baumannii TaxID=470 RepID=UPI0020903629